MWAQRSGVSKRSGRKLKREGFLFETEKQLPVIVEGKKIGIYVPDIIINEKIMLEIKTKEFITKQDIRQFWQYLRATSYKLGFLINFGKPGGVEIIRKVYDTARNTQPFPRDSA
jgi:GxxExxY protein